jgi:hypothetical protein
LTSARAHPLRPGAPLTPSHGDELAAVAREAAKVAHDLFALTASWARLLGRVFVTRRVERCARALVRAGAPRAAACGAPALAAGADEAE